jgi:hypothetical protein
MTFNFLHKMVINRKSALKKQLTKSGLFAGPKVLLGSETNGQHIDFQYPNAGI